MTNDELLAALQSQLPNHAISERDLTIFALGVEVGAAPPSLPETVTDAQWMAEFERLANDLAGAAFRHGYACRSREDDSYNEAMDAEVESKDAARRKADAALLAHIGKRPAMSDSALIADLEHRARWWRQPAVWKLAPGDAALDFADEIDRAVAAIRALSTAPAQPSEDAYGVLASSNDQGENHG